jgi:hypothetical protein
MNGTEVTNTLALATLSADDDVAGVADIDGDGRVDLIIQSSANGTASGWLVKGRGISGTIALPTPPDGWLIRD